MKTKPGSDSRSPGLAALDINWARDFGRSIDAQKSTGRMQEKREAGFMRPFRFARKASSFVLISGILVAGPLAAQPALVFSPGASVAGHWTGKAVPVAAQADYQSPWNLDLKLTQDGNNVTGTFAMIGSDNVPGKAYELHGMIQGGRIGVTAEISPVEHPHFRMSLVNGVLVGEVWNFHDEPNRWPFDSDRTFALKKVP